jgi:hypothetical protein
MLDTIDDNVVRSLVLEQRARRRWSLDVVFERRPHSPILLQILLRVRIVSDTVA